MQVGRMTVLLLVLAPLLGCLKVDVAVGPQRTPLATETLVLESEGVTRQSATVALIDVSGVIVNGGQPRLIGLGEAPNPVAHLAADLQKAATDDDVAAVVLRINSPGGTATASELMYRSVERFQEDTGKPVVALMMDSATSGGYLTALPADHIVAHPTTITGSIGVILPTVSVQPALERWGIAVDEIRFGENKNAGSPLTAPDAGQRETLQAVIDDMGERFVATVRADRPGVVEAEARGETVLDGRIFSGERALEVGLVDQLGDLRDAFAEAVRRAGHSEARLVRYDREAQPVPVPEASWRGLLPTTLQGTGAWYLWEAGAR